MKIFRQRSLTTFLSMKRSKNGKYCTAVGRYIHELEGSELVCLIS